LTLEEEGRRREGEREMWKGKEEEAVRELSRVWDLRWFGTWRRRSQASSQASQAVSSLKERAVRQLWLALGLPPQELSGDSSLRDLASPLWTTQATTELPV
jgi:hypothetical protein